jgi:hypothetical protein
VLYLTIHQYRKYPEAANPEAANLLNQCLAVYNVLTSPYI